jgi:hypothetical protein
MDLDKDARERSFMDQTQRYYASGGDLAALFKMNGLRSRVSFEDCEWGSTRLLLAAQRGMCSAIKWLLQNGADVHRGRPVDRETPLKAAVYYNQREAAVLLLDAGARLDDFSVFGRTALMDAVYQGSINMSKFLLSRGASLDVSNNGGRDPEDYAHSIKSWPDHSGQGRRRKVAKLLTAVRESGGWAAYVAAPRLELLALRRALPALRESGRASPSSVLVHERLFLRADVPDDVFSHVLKYWRSDHDYEACDKFSWESRIKRT